MEVLREKKEICVFVECWDVDFCVVRAADRCWRRGLFTPFVAEKVQWLRHNAGDSFHCPGDIDSLQECTGQQTLINQLNGLAFRPHQIYKRHRERNPPAFGFYRVGTALIGPNERRRSIH